MALVPAIVDDGQPLFESLAITLYLARKAGKLWPSTVYGEGLAFQWTLFGGTEVEPVLGQWAYHTLLLPPDERKPEIAADCAAKLPRRFDAIEAALAGREWLADDDVHHRRPEPRRGPLPRARLRPRPLAADSRPGTRAATRGRRRRPPWPIGKRR